MDLSAYFFVNQAHDTASITNYSQTLIKNLSLIISILTHSMDSRIKVFLSTLITIHLCHFSKNYLQDGSSTLEQFLKQVKNCPKLIKLSL